MTYQFRPASSYTDRHGLFIALVGGTNSGKTFSALRLARGIAGPQGKIAVADTEGGRTLHLKDEFAFDVVMMDPPHRPDRYAELARDAEAAGYAALVIDSFSAEWAGVGGVLAWSDDEAQRMAQGDASRLDKLKGASWIKPKRAHKNMVFSLLERRIPIIFSIRGEESFKPPAEKFFKPVCNKEFLFEVTVSFRLAADRKGVIDLSDAKSWKMEKAHRAIFQDGELLTEAHGEKLAAWARGGQPPQKTAGGPASTAASGPAGAAARFAWEQGNGQKKFFASAAEWRDFVLAGLAKVGAERAEKARHTNATNLEAARLAGAEAEANAIYAAIEAKVAA